MIKKLIVITLIISGTALFAQDEKTEIKWYDFEEAVKLNAENPKKIFIDMYTDWCGWCKRMDQTTFSNEEIIRYMNENYYAVKFDAERTDTVYFKDREFVNTGTGRRATHQLAQALLNGRMSYPSYVFIDGDNNPLTIVPGYMEPATFEPILHYFSDDAYKREKWETYKERFESKL